jgi:hypothetical protein
MPKDKVDTAIKRASGAVQKNYDTVIYEGYAPHGVPVIVETATDNLVRTVANVRVPFKNWGGNLGASGSVKDKKNNPLKPEGRCEGARCPCEPGEDSGRARGVPTAARVRAGER